MRRSRLQKGAGYFNVIVRGKVVDEVLAESEERALEKAVQRLSVKYKPRKTGAMKPKVEWMA
jgi:hypothetical protein